MNRIFTILLLLLGFNCVAQKINRAGSFKAINYKPDGTIYNTRVESIKDTASVFDLYFIAKHFYNIPLPPSFKNVKYKHKRIEVLIGDTKETKRSRNCTYDNLSSVISFGESGCMICNDLGYQYNVHYNNHGQVDTLTGSPNTMSQSNTYKIRFRANGDVKQVDLFEGGKLSAQVLLI